MLKAVRNNPVTFALLLTVIMGYAYSKIDWPTDKYYHLSGRKGFNFHWHAWIVMHYIIGLIILSIRFFKMSELDKDVLIAYFAFDVYGFAWYLYNGWPENTELIITGFCLGCIILILIRLWKKLAGK